MSRWPRSIYEEGSEPDYRFTLANERTFLAWIRTSLGLLAAGIVVETIGPSDLLSKAAAPLLVGTAMLCAVGAWFNWARTERSIRRGEPIARGGGVLLVLVGFVLLLGALALVVLAGD